MSDFFKFEDEGEDFPFYNGIPKLSIGEWVILALAPILMGLIILTPTSWIPYYNSIPNSAIQVTYFLVTFIPIAYVCHGKLGLLFKKPRLNDFKVIIICVILYIVWGLLVNYIGSSLGFTVSANAISKTPLSILDGVFIAIQLMAEDFFKVSILLIGMGLIYNFTKNRKSALVFGVFASMMIFGLAHMTSYDNNLFQCVVTIGIGTVIHLYPYLKTKNFVNTYITHIIIDLGVLTFINILMSLAAH